MVLLSPGRVEAGRAQACGFSEESLAACWATGSSREGLVE